MTNVILSKSDNCECEIDLRLIQDHNSIKTKLVKQASIIKICNYHERLVRSEYLKRIKKQQNNVEYLKMKELLSDLSNEIKNT